MISHELKSVFVHCQKCAGESIEHAIFGSADKNYRGDPFEGTPEKHFTAEQYISKLGREIWDQYFTFAFVRNPWDRVVSWIKYRDLRYKRTDDISPEKIISEAQTPMFQAFTYTKMLFDSKGRCCVDFIGRFENIQHDFDIVCSKLGVSKDLPVLNKTKHKPYWCYYNEEAINAVAEIYQDDIRNFGFEFGKKDYELLHYGRITNQPKIIKLSVLIASLKNRELTLQRLIKKLGVHPSVEILLEIDSGELSIGAKRQKLLDRANGQYIVYLDDDDDVHEYFIQKILDKIQLSPDAIGYWIDHYIDGRKRFVKKMTLGLSSQVMYQNNMLSPLTHRAVVRREILNGFTFPDIDWAEDRPYWKYIEQKLNWDKVILLDQVLYYQFEKTGKYSADGKHNGK